MAATLKHFLSRVVVRMSALDSYTLHTVLWKAFPGPGARPFLFRADRQLDAVDDGPRPILALVQSIQEPRWSISEVLSAEMHPVERTLAEGDQLRFLLRANPTVARKGRKEPKFKGVEGDAFLAARGRRVAIVRDDARLAWLARKADANGFAIETSAIVRAQTVFWSKGSRRARHDGVDFEGTLRVTDGAKLRDAIQGGVGSGKAFGFGLLSTK